MKNFSIIFNPAAGRGEATRYAMQLKSLLQQKHGTNLQNVACMEIKGRDDAYQFAKYASSQCYDMVVAIGGDGTIRQVAGGLIEGGGDTPLGIIPLGSVNNLAHALDIPLNPKLAMELLLYGEKKAIDVGKVNDTYMVSSMTVGFLADIAKNVTTKEKREWGPLAFLKDLFYVLKAHKRYYLEISYDNGILSQRTELLLISMTSSLGGVKSLIPQATADDGYFHLYSIPHVSIGELFKNLSTLLTGSLDHIPGVSYIKTTSLTIHCYKRRRKRENPSKVAARIDGEPGYLLPVNMRVINKALSIIVPPYKRPQYP